MTWKGPSQEMAEYLQNMDRDKHILELAVPARKPLFLWSIGNDAQHVALNHLLLGNKEDAHRWIVEAAVCFRRSLEGYLALPPRVEEVRFVEMGEVDGTKVNGTLLQVPEDAVASAMHLVGVAALAGDPTMAESMRILERTEFGEDWKLLGLYVKALSTLSLGEDAEARGWLVKLKPEEARSARRFQGWIRVTSQVLESMLDKDVGRFVDLLSQATDSFARRVRATGDTPVFLKGLNWIAVARRRGMSIQTESFAERTRKLLPWPW